MANKFTYIFLAILFLASDWLYIKGEFTRQPQSLNGGFSVIAFTSPGSAFNPTYSNTNSTLTFFIENQTHHTKKYHLEYFINDTKIYRDEININPQEKKTLDAVPIVKNYLKKNNFSSKKELILRIKVHTKNNHWQITKILQPASAPSSN